MTPELLGASPSVRIPELRSVPLTPRIAALVDHPNFQRLRQVRQLGPTHLVYPGAVHTRFEHSLGVYDMARGYLGSLLADPLVGPSITERDVSVCLLGCLLHDLGHYPFAHSLEAVHRGQGDAPRHEDLSVRQLLGELDVDGGPTIGALIESGFGVAADEVADLIRHKPKWHKRPERRLVATVLSSGIDADKADYLERDAIHMGVGYGRNMDLGRLIASIVATPSCDSIGITNKGRVAAEILMFCRYTMFSEAYWHHTVRAASSMMERALADYWQRESPDGVELTRVLLRYPDDALVAWLLERAPKGSLTAVLLGAMSGGRRRLMKRILTLSRIRESREEQLAYERIYHLSSEQLDDLEVRLREVLSRLLGREVKASELLVDTPPRDKDRVEPVWVVDTRGERTAVPLDTVSKVAQGVGTDFIKVVKKIRVFVAPEVRDAVASGPGFEAVWSRLLDTILSFQPAPAAQQRLFS